MCIYTYIYSAAETEKEFKGAGQKVGIEIWRVENRRSEDDRPIFGVKRWPVSDYGSFYTGDSYIVLNTYKAVENGKVTDRLAWDAHFWLGKESSQDEIGVAAYKTVELSDLLDEGPVHHREVQENESQLFQTYFKHIHYMEGGIGSGFHHVGPDEYTPRLIEIRRTKRIVRAFEIPVSVKSMNVGDVFVLDAGLKIYCYLGPKANAFEKMKGGALQHNIVSSRLGKAKKSEIDGEFWKILGGTERDVGPEIQEAAGGKIYILISFLISALTYYT
jgi:gelsolin